jgi:YVTN family beta-propeller protein
MRALIAAAAALFALTGAQAADYTISRTIPLGPPDKWDYLVFEPTKNRVYAAHGTEVTVVDVASGTVVGRVPGLASAHGVAIIPALGRGFAASGKTDKLVAFDLETLKPVGTIPAGSDPDALVYDPASGHLLVMDGDGNAVTVIDPGKSAVVATIPLKGQPEFGAVDGAGKLFVNIESTKELVRIDTATNKIEARWPIAACDAPHGLSIDVASHLLFPSCVNGIMLAVDDRDGHIVATLAIGKGSDATAVDTKNRLAFSSNGDGTLSVATISGPAAVATPVSVATAPGARTMAVDQGTGRLFMVTADVAGTPAPGTRPNFTPGSVKLLVLDPKP